MNLQADPSLSILRSFIPLDCRLLMKSGVPPWMRRLHQLIRLRMRVSQLLSCPIKSGRNSMNRKAINFVEIHVVIALLFQILYPLRRRTVDSHGDELVRVRLVASCLRLRTISGVTP